MAYRWNGIECDTLEELNALCNQRTVKQSAVKAYSNAKEIVRVLADNSTYAMWERKWIWCEEHNCALSNCADRH